jgi:hypothetical protein
MRASMPPAGLSIGLSTVVLLTLVAGGAKAQERDTRENEAKKACLAGKLERGIELLADLYADTNDPTYIYNQARCFEQNGKSPEALTRFREYLRKSPNLPADDKAAVQARITELEGQTRAASPSAPAPASAPAVAPGPSRASAASLTPERDTARDLRISGLTTAAVGVVVLAGGIYMGLRTHTLEREVTADAQNGLFSQGKYDEGRRDEVLQWLGYGVGAVALVGGGVLYFLGARSTAAESGAVTAMPELGPGRAGASLRVTF